MIRRLGNRSVQAGHIGVEWEHSWDREERPLVLLSVGRFDAGVAWRWYGRRDELVWVLALYLGILKVVFWWGDPYREDA